IALSLGFEAAKQGWVGLILHPGARNVNTHPMLGDNNGVAQGMMMLVPLFAMLMATATRRWERLFYLFMAAGAVLRGLATYSRGGFLAVLVVGLLWLARSQRKTRVVIGAAVLAVLVVSVMPAAFWDRMSTLQNSAEEQDDSVRGRFHFWKTASDMAATH